MSYNEQLADRVRELIAAVTNKVVEKKMFGGLCFMVNDKMCVTVKSNRIMVRVAPEKFREAVENEGLEPMVHGGKTMTGFGYVSHELLDTKKKLAYWVLLALDYNKVALSSGKGKS